MRPLRTLTALVFLLVLVYGGLGANSLWGKGSMTPGLALDLEGGTQLILTPSAEGAEITDAQIKEAIRIMRQRVNASGVSEAEISSQGGTNIVVQLPGNPSEETIQLVQASAQLRFRAVLTQAGPGQIDPGAVAEQQNQSDGGASGDQASSGDQGSSGEQPTDGPGAEESASPSGGTVGGAAARATGDDPSDQASDEATEEPSDEATDQATEEPSDTPSEQPQGYTQEEIEAAARQAADTNGDGKLSDTPATDPTSASDTAWITEKVMYDFYMLDCTDPANLAGGGGDDPDQPLVACAAEGNAKYILGPAELEGTDVASANSALGTTQSGAVTNEYIVQLNFTSEGGQKFREVTQRLASLASTGQNQFAIVLDRLVVSAPSVDEVIAGGQAQISGSAANPFTQDQTISLANQLNYGSLPITFELRSQEEISATLGTEQLERGMLAGLIGLALVVVYSIVQYRGLATVTLLSLTMAGALTYGSITALSELMGYRLSLAGVAGLIIAIGITADSFIVYFERIRDEVREGRRLEDAVELGWARARRTILASDAVNLLAAIVLYTLAVGGVRGFAFTLGLTTVIDVIVVMLFTHPMVQLLVRTKFFGDGHRFSGLDPVHLGSTVPIYRGRGRLRTGESIAERRRAAEVAAARGSSASGSAESADSGGSPAEPDDPPGGSGSDAAELSSTSRKGDR